MICCNLMELSRWKQRNLIKWWAENSKNQHGSRTKNRYSRSQLYYLRFALNFARLFPHMGKLNLQEGIRTLQLKRYFWKQYCTDYHEVALLLTVIVQYLWNKSSKSLWTPLIHVYFSHHRNEGIVLTMINSTVFIEAKFLAVILGTDSNGNTLGFLLLIISLTSCPLRPRWESNPRWTIVCRAS